MALVFNLNVMIHSWVSLDYGMTFYKIVCKYSLNNVAFYSIISFLVSTFKNQSNSRFLTKVNQ